MIKNKDEIGILKLKRILLSNGIIKADVDRKNFERIRYYEKKLRIFFQKNFGYNLITKQKYAKLEKFPMKNGQKDWMTLKINDKRKKYELKNKNDFIFLCILLAYSDEKGKGYQFLLDELVKEIKLHYSTEFKDENEESTINETEFENKITFENGSEGLSNRRSLVTAIKFAEYYGVLRTVDADYEDLGNNADAKALLEVVGNVEYMMNSMFKEIGDASNLEELFEKNEFTKLKFDVEPKMKLIRRLTLQPIVMVDELDEDELDFLDDFRKRQSITNFFQNEMGMDVEYYGDMIIAIDEFVDIFENFPSRREDYEGKIALKKDVGMPKVVILLMNRLANLKIHRLSKSDFNFHVSEVIKEYNTFLTKGIKDKTITTLSKEVIKIMKMWGIITEENDYYHLNNFIYRIEPKLIIDEEE